ncbi:MAG: hypothetical protein U0872_07490 [Planctomycetaceae bacterium]
MNVDFTVRDFFLRQDFFGSACHGRGALEDADDCRSLRSTIARGTAEQVVGSDASLPIGRSREGDLRRAPEGGIARFTWVPHGIDIGVGGLEKFVDANAVSGPTQSSPASTASLFSGRTPIPSTTNWVVRLAPDFNLTVMLLAIDSNPSADSPSSSVTLFLASVCTIGVVISFVGYGGST